jgi:hypothetical protein
MNSSNSLRRQARRIVLRPRRSRRIIHFDQLEHRSLLTLLGQQLFPSDNPWNQQITNAPIASNSNAILNNLISSYGNGLFHPDFGQSTPGSGSSPIFGFPYNVVHGNTQPKVHVVIDSFPNESDLVDAPIPANAVLQGDLEDGPNVGVANRGDSHLIVWDEDNNIDYEFFEVSRPSENSDGQWHAAQESVWNMNTDAFRTIGFTSANAAGLPILPSLARPDEALPVSQGGQGVINHALGFTLPTSIVLDEFLYPASHTANPNNTNVADEAPMGVRFRLKASVDISQFDPESKIIAQALKDYGMLLDDNGGPSVFLEGAGYSVDANDQPTLTWNDADIHDTLHGLQSLTFSNFEVVDSTPAVTGLSNTTGSAGSTVTILGQSFSGASGHLQVLFGSTPASNVTVVDDSHVTAVIPAGSGTVDVRVQSGITTANDPSNYENPIFGYGISPITANDRFTYSASTPPTVTAMSPSIGPPSGGTVVTITGTNFTNATAVEFGGVNASSFTINSATTITATAPAEAVGIVDVMVTNPSGTSVTTAADKFTYDAPPTLATPASASPSPVNGTSTILRVLGAYVGGEANLIYTWATVGTPPAPVTFSDQSTNTAKSTTATFTKAGVYTFLVTITDPDGLSTTSSVGVTVAQTLTSVTVSPASVTLAPGGTEQFTAQGSDQFGNPLSTQPSFNWSVTTGSGTVSSSGLYTAAMALGTAVIQAGSAGVFGVAQAVTSSTSATIWMDDAFPAGAVTASDGPSWTWAATNPPPFSGNLDLQSPVLAGEHQQYFYNAANPLSVPAGGTLSTYVYLDPANPPSEVMLQWNVGGSWEHRAYWGANAIPWGSDGTASRQSMGALPTTGGWVQLTVPASAVGLDGQTVTGMAFTLYNGRASFDDAGENS